jgi:predicted metal-binding membrane protein
MIAREPQVERWLRRDRLVVGAALAVVCLLAWGWTLAGAGMGVSAVGMTRMVYGNHSAMAEMWMPAAWTPAYAAVMFLMWWVMMIAMMLPSAASVILLAARVNRTADPAQAPFGSSAHFVSGYLAAWGAFSLAATLAQWGLQEAGLLSSMTMSSTNKVFGVVLLGSAAVWQFTPWKASCLRNCRTPIEWLMASRGRPAFLAGLHHGAYCVGCCWLLMALLFLGGVMNLFWIAGLGILVLAEKLLAPGWGFSLLCGVALGVMALILVVG